MAMRAHRDIGLYVHIPFCKQRCHFCAFYLEVARTERMQSFCTALAQEVDLYRREGLVGLRPLRSIYFGGGTPTALPSVQLVSLLRHGEPEHVVATSKTLKQLAPVLTALALTAEEQPALGSAEPRRRRFRRTRRDDTA